MMKLRVLHIYWIDKKNSNITKNNDGYHNKSIQTINQLVQWLKDYLPSIYLAANDLYYDHNTITI